MKTVYYDTNIVYFLLNKILVSHYFMGKNLRNCLLFNFGAIWNIRPKNSKKTGAKPFIKKVHTPANEFQTHQDFNILYLICSECVISFLPSFQVGVLR